MIGMLWFMLCVDDVLNIVYDLLLLISVDGGNVMPRLSGHDHCAINNCGN